MHYFNFSDVRYIKSGGGPNSNNVEQFFKSTEIGDFYHNVLVNASGPYDNKDFPIKQNYLNAINEPNGTSWAYRNYFWVIPDHVVLLQGIYGQFVYPTLN